MSLAIPLEPDPYRARLLLVDGLNLIRRIYAACTKDTQHNPLDQTRTRSAQALQRLLLEHKPSHALCVFDGEQPNWRRQLYPAYKTNRKPMPEALRDHLDEIQQQFWQLGVDSLLSQQEEADDLIASISIKAAYHLEVIIISTDHGYGQLLSSQIKQWDPFLRRSLDQHFYQQRYGIEPSLLPLYSALVGSNSHNIKGIPGIGAKTAASLLNRYSDINSLLNAEDIADKIKTNLRDATNTLATNYRILTFNSSIPLGFSMRDIRYQGEKNE
jgi:protein Xni